MKRNRIRLLALLLAVMMVLAACGGDTKTTANPSNSGQPDATSSPAQPEKGSEPLKDLVLYQAGAGDMETLFVLNSESGGELDYLANTTAGLLEVNNKGQFIPAIATEWGTDDGGLTWTFKLRDDVVWVDINGNEMAKCTAQDWLTSLEFVLNFHKNEAKNSSMPRQMIAGAQEYFDMVREMDESEALALKATDDLFKQTVGIEAPDDYTLVYHCVTNIPYFDSLAVSAALLPLAQGQVDQFEEPSDIIASENTQLWYNGPYILSEFIHSNSKRFTRNESYYDKECTLFDTVTILMVSDSLTGQQLFMNGDVDYTQLSESNLRTIYEDPNNEWNDNLVEGRLDKYSFQVHFNFYKKLEDGSEDTNWNNAIANESFRKSLYYGMDLSNYWARTNFINPDKCENVAYTMKGLLYFSDGTDYVERVWEKIGLPDGRGRYDAEKAQQYKEQAMQELAGKVQFPIELDHYIAASNQDALDNAIVIKEIVEGLGTDYITVNIKTFTSSWQKEVTSNRLHSWNFGTGWGADYADPENFLFQEIYDEPGAIFSMNASFINEASDPQLIEDYKTYTSMVREAMGVYDDMDERYEKFADAEAYLIDKAFVIPASYRVNWRLTKINAYTQKYAMFGMQNNMWKNWETSVEAYTGEQYAQFEANFNAQ